MNLPVTRKTRPHFERVFRPLQRTVDQLWTTLATEGEKGETSASILVSAVEPGAGTTTVAGCAAIGLAHHLQSPTVLVETHPSRDLVSKLFGVPAAPGLSNVLEGQSTLDEAIGDPGYPNLSVLPYGSSESNTPSVQALREVFGQLTQSYRYVILDSPPILDDPSTRVILSTVDRVVLVVRAGVSTEHRAKQALQVVQDAGVELVGLVMNNYTPEVPEWLMPSKWD